MAQQARTDAKLLDIKDMGTDRRIAIVGSGGHAKVVFSVLQASGIPLFGFYDDAAESWGTTVLGIRVRGPIAAIADEGVQAGILGLGDNRTRHKLAGELEIEWLTAVHPHAWVHPSVLLEGGTVVCAGAVIQPECKVGRHVIVNTGATVDHDSVIGDFVHLAPGSHLAGSVRAGEGSLVGIGAAVIPGRRIGAWATVGAGSVVVHDVPEGATAVGVPARVRPTAPRDSN